MRAAGMSIQRRTMCLLTGDAAGTFGGPRKAPMEDPSLPMEELVALSTGLSPGAHRTSVLLHKNLLHPFLLLPAHQGADVNFQDRAACLGGSSDLAVQFQSVTCPLLHRVAFQKINNSSLSSSPILGDTEYPVFNHCLKCRIFLSWIKNMFPSQRGLMLLPGSPSFFL